MTFAHLWNDMPMLERERLAPYMTETHILHLKQVRTMIADAHQAEMRKLDGWIAILELDLRKSEQPLPIATGDGQ